MGEVDPCATHRVLFVNYLINRDESGNLTAQLATLASVT